MSGHHLPKLVYSTSERADLHLHSHYSDGQHPPRKLAQLAAQKGLSVIALTDHATTEGIAEMIAEAAQWGIYNLPAIELNARTGDFLGYYIDYEHQGLLAFLRDMNALREKRMRATVTRLNELGHQVDWFTLVHFSHPALPSRSHIARMLVALGRFPNVDAVFHTLLGRGQSAYIEPEAPSDEECIRIICEAGGLAVLAHPQYLNVALDNIPSYAHQLASWGLSGYERIPDRANLLPVAATWEKAGKENNFFEMDGSGFHGEEISTVSLGDLTIGADAFPKMEARLPDSSAQKSFFKRMYWRSTNLSPEEFRQSLFPIDIYVKTQGCLELLDFQPALAPLPADFTGLPFVLLGPGALDHDQEIVRILEDFGCQMIAEDYRTHYSELAWTLYRMYQLPRHVKRQEALRFELDHYLYGARADDYRLIFFSNLLGASLRDLKQHIRSAIGTIKFYRVTCGDLMDTFFTAYVHMPDDEDIHRECWILHQTGAFVPIPSTAPYAFSTPLPE